MGICRFIKQHLELAGTSHDSTPYIRIRFFSYPTSFQFVYYFLNALLSSHKSTRDAAFRQHKSTKPMDAQERGSSAFFSLFLQ
jgi:hypothetical protein